MAPVMTAALRLALARLRRRPAAPAILAVALSLLIGTPVAVRLLGDAAAARLTARAAATPFVLGARGGAADLALAALAFAPPPQSIPLRAVERVRESGLADAHPLHLGFSVRGAPVVGVEFDYFAFRDLALAKGRAIALIGEAVLGAGVAARLGLAPGDALTVTPADAFDLAGAQPVALSVVGVLAPTGQPEDEAALVDLRTAWVIAGIGHAHARAAGAIAPPEPAPLRLTPDLLETLHFHGDPGDFPVSVAVVVPRDGRSAAILAGRYLDPDADERLVASGEVAARLIGQVLRLRPALDAAALAAGVGGGALFALAWSLAVKLRAGERRYFDEIGAPARLFAAALVWEGLAVALAGLALAAAAGALTVASLGGAARAVLASAI